MQFTFPFQLCLIALLTVSSSLKARAADTPSPPANTASDSIADFVSRFCVDCHNRNQTDGGLNLRSTRNVEDESAAVTWERVVRKLRARQMPPATADHPTESQYARTLTLIESVLDRNAARHARPGRTATFRRLTRYEYQNVMRDLLAIEINAGELLPVDPVSHGFDNVTVGELSPVLMNRYLTAAETIAQLAVGRSGRGPASKTFRVRPDVTQEKH
ncbi:MAG: DUF1587 domain-containing protein, partial [Planctomycetaceae bacterium]